MARLLLSLWLVAWAAPAAAQAQAETGQSKAAAEALFREGRALLEQGKTDAACAKLDQSLRLDRSPGTLLNLADCHERQGRTASAWAEFLESARLAEDSGWQAGAREASRRAQALEAGLSRITVRVSEPAEGLVVSLDGSSLEQAALGTPLPIDPGEHALSAEAPGRAPWSTRVRVAAQGDHQEAVVPALAASSEAPPADSAASGDTLAAAENGGATTEGAGDGSILPYALGGVGVAALAAGVVFGVLAKGSYEDAKTLCPEHVRCDQEALDTYDDALLQANLSNVGFGVGIVALSVAVALLLTGDENEEAGRVSAPSLRAVLSPQHAGASVSARF